MNIAVYAPGLFKDGFSAEHEFIVETFFSLIRLHSNQTFFLITEEKQTSSFQFPSNTEVVFAKLSSPNVLLKKIWWDVKLPSVLKKQKADFFISFGETCSLKTSIPQFIVFPDVLKTKLINIKKARLAIVTNKSAKQTLIEKYGVIEKNIICVHPFANQGYAEITYDNKERIKTRYSEGKEFFLYSSSFPSNDNFIELLKGFSHFKKRQQSSFKLLLLTRSNSFFDKQLSTYKYREDVTFIEAKEKGISENITAAAYAMVLPFNLNEDIITVLNAMRSGVPVIATKNSSVEEVASDAALYTDTATIKEIGEKMIQLYTNETLRSLLIEKGKNVVSKFSTEITTGLLWQSFMKAL